MDPRQLPTEIANVQRGIDAYLKEVRAFDGWLRDTLASIRSVCDDYALTPTFGEVRADVRDSERGGVELAIGTERDAFYASVAFDPGRWGIDVRRTVRFARHPTDNLLDETPHQTLGWRDFAGHQVVDAIGAFVETAAARLAAARPPAPPSRF